MSLLALEKGSSRKGSGDRKGIIDPDTTATAQGANNPAPQPGAAGAQQGGLEAQGEAADQAQGAAQDAPAYEYTAPVFGENRVSYPFLVLRALAILAVIILTIYLVFRVFLKNRHKIVTGTDLIKVLATYPLAGNKSIQIIEIAEKVLILGVADANINLITTLEDKATIDRIKLESSKATKGFASFKDQLLKLISGKAFTGQGQISYFNEFKQRINKMKKM